MNDVKAPVLALWLSKPSDGWPLYQDWLVTAHDIFHQGYEGWRETVEVKCDDSHLGKAVQFGCLHPTQGIGSSSILVFGLLFTFHNLRDSMTEQETADFVRPAQGHQAITWIRLFQNSC